MDYLCLGFSGNAKGEKEIADYMAELQMCAFVSDYDHNAPGSEHLINTHFAYPIYTIIKHGSLMFRVLRAGIGFTAN